MTTTAPHPRSPQRFVRTVAGLAAAAALAAVPLPHAALQRAQAASTSKSKPQTVSLRLASVNQSTRLVAPGLAMSRATRSLVPGQSLTFPSEPLRRPLRIDSRPFIRLHLAHTVPGDVTLYARLEVVTREGGIRVMLPNHAVTVPESLLSQGAPANVDARLPHVVGALAEGEQLQLVISELGSSPTDALHPDVMTVYLGALPGEDTDTHDTGQVLDESKGGKNPARISLSVTGVGPFQQW